MHLLHNHFSHIFLFLFSIPFLFFLLFPLHLSHWSLSSSFSTLRDNKHHCHRNNSSIDESLKATWSTWRHKKLPCTRLKEGEKRKKKVKESDQIKIILRLSQQSLLIREASSTVSVGLEWERIRRQLYHFARKRTKVWKSSQRRHHCLHHWEILDSHFEIV
jgi:hypothetical protein